MSKYEIRRVNLNRKGRKNAIERHTNDLYVLLRERLKDNQDFVTKNGFLRTPEIAKKIGYSNEAIYKWLRTDRITIRGANKIIGNFEGMFRIEDFVPFFAIE